MLATLDRLGLAENTLVIFCSDHGEMLGDHGLSQKNTPYEASVRIPFLLRWPGRVPAGGVSDVAVSLLDVFPTLLAETPATLPEGSPPLPGASLLDPAIGERERVAIDFGFDEERWVCLRSPEKKFVFWACGGRVEAYDLAADPDERRNLAELPEPPAWVADWRADLLAWERASGLADRSLTGRDFRVWPEPPTPPEPLAGRVEINDGRWADRLPPGHPYPVETAAEAFDRAIAKETTLSPEKLNVAAYVAQGGSLEGTAWARRAAGDSPPPAV